MHVIREAATADIAQRALVGTSLYVPRSAQQPSLKEAGDPPALAVSIVVAVLGNARDLPGLLDARQPGHGSRLFELVVVDNHPTAVVDAGLFAAARFGWQLVHQPEPGLSRARNAGLRRARGACVLITDPDSRPNSSWVAELAAALIEHGVVVAGGPAIPRLPVGATLRPPLRQWFVPPERPEDTQAETRREPNRTRSPRDGCQCLESLYPGAVSQYSMSAPDVVTLMERLATRGVEACIGGGWAVDALLKEQTREHSDLDVWAPSAHLERLFIAFVEVGISLIFPWPGDRPWNFVLHDGVRRRVDLHLYEPLADGSLHYGSVVEGVSFPAEALAGQGSIGGVAVGCESAGWAVRWHTGYPAREVDRHDVPLLCQRFGIPLPEGFEAVAQEPRPQL